MRTRTLICLISFLCLTGCATLTPKEKFYLGKVKTSRITDHASHNFWSAQTNVNEEKRVLSLKDKSVFWYGEMMDSYLWGGLTAHWFDPQNKEFKKTPCNNADGFNFYAELPIDGQIGAERAGEWHVEIRSSKGELLDTQQFYIGELSSTDVALSKEVQEELKMADAEAICLLHEEKVEVMNEFLYKKTLHRKIKILKEQGKSWAEFSLPFVAGVENIVVNYAYTTLPNGKVVNAKDVTVTTTSENFPNYSAQKVFVMTLPAVEVGSIIDFEVITRSMVPRASGMFFDGIAFAETIPSVQSKYTLEIPESMSLSIKNLNTDIRPEVSTASGKKTYLWTAKNIKAVPVEMYMPPFRSFGAVVLLTTAKDWQQVAGWWRDLTKDKYKTNPELEQYAKEITASATTDYEKVRALYHHFKQKVRYVGLSFGSTLYEPSPAVDVFKSKYGDCKDQSVLLITMLRSLGIKSDIALVRTPDLGPLAKEHPSPGEFNHAIVVVDLKDKRYYLDPTTENYPIGRTPYWAEGSDLLIIREDKYEFDHIPVSSYSQNMVETRIALNIKEDLSIDGTIQFNWTNQEAPDIRTYFMYLKPNEKENTIQQMLKNFYSYAVMDHYELVNPDDIEKDFGVKITFKLKDWLNVAGDLYLFKWMGDEVLSFPSYLGKTRIQPLHFFQQRLTKAEIAIELPPSLKIKSLPKDFNLASSRQESTIHFKAEGNTITATQSITSIAQDIPVKDVEEYKQEWEKIIRAHREQVVLEKR